MSNSLSIACPSMGGHEAAVTSWEDTMSRPWPVVIDGTREGEQAGFLSKCEHAWRQTSADVIGYLHSDLYILEKDWDVRVLAAFDDPRVAVVGFVGATGLGHQDFGKIRYDFRQLARFDVWSALSDWENHGNLLEGSKNAAVIDSCAVFCRRSLLERVGGFPVGRYPNHSHCSDLWLCLIAHRLGYSIKMLGIKCTHRSGGKGEAGTRWISERGTDEQMHRRAHELIAEDFRDVLPVRVK